MAFKKAERKKLKLKLAITGPSGSGKTYSALRISKGLGGKIAVVDTENKSAALYSDRFEFDVLELEPPYTNEKYLTALNDAQKAGYDVLIIDSLTHQWAGEGGLLNKKEQLDARGGNSYTNWAKMTPEHEKFKSAILHADMHVIGTMRSKQDYVLQLTDKGKQAPVKVGLAPIQREGMEYEFTTVFDVAMNHEAVVSKDRTGLFVDEIFQITENTGIRLAEWIAKGKDAEVIPPIIAPSPVAKPVTNIVLPPKAALPEEHLVVPAVIADLIIPDGKNKGKRLGDMPTGDIETMVNALQEIKNYGKHVPVIYVELYEVCLEYLHSFNGMQNEFENFQA